MASSKDVLDLVSHICSAVGSGLAFFLATVLTALVTCVKGEVEDARREVEGRGGLEREWREGARRKRPGWDSLGR